MNILISLVGLGTINFARKMVWYGAEMGFKRHLIILLFKLMIYSIIIGLFLINIEKNFWLPFILSGMINITLFHFIEAFVIQRKLINNRDLNV